MKIAEISLFLLSIYYNQLKASTEVSKLPGISGCVYVGSLMDACNKTNFPISDMPKECTSFIYYAAFVDSKFKVNSTNQETTQLEFLSKVINSGKPSFLCYGHENFKAWLDAIKNNHQNGGENAKTEISNLKTYLEPYKDITGLIINNFIWEIDSTINPDFVADFKVYLDELKNTFPTYTIGLDLFGRNLITYFSNSTNIKWFNFTDLDACIDFYHIDVFQLIECTKDNMVGGVTPISSSIDNTYSLDRIPKILTNLGIPKDKTHFTFRTGPNTIEYGVSECDCNNAQLCAAPNLDGMCSDNTKTYYDKGAFAKQYGVGFIGYDMDITDDPYGCCQCGTSFLAFHRILAGFTGAPSPAPCPLFDKQ